MILGFLFFIQTFLKHCKALSTEKYRRYINILLLLLLRWRRSKKSTSRPQLHVQDCSSRRKTYIAFVKGQSVTQKLFFFVQQNVQGCWFVDGKVPSIRMQVKQETFLLISFLNNVIESAKQKKLHLL